MYTAVKPVYVKKTNSYTVQVIRDANVLLAHEGFMVYDDAARALESVRAGRLISGWPTRKKDAVTAFLTSEAAK